MKKKLFLLSTISAIALSACSLTGVKHDISEYILETPYMDNYKILQLTDPHIGDKDDQDLHYKFMDLTIREANPNMIIVTGDLFTVASKGTAKRFFDFLESYEVPWTVTFGNHDEQCYFSVEWLTSYLNNFGKHCLFKDIQDDNLQGNCNFAINLMQGNNIFEQVIIMDTNRYYYGSYFGYDYIKDNQIEWYKELVDYTATQNGGAVVKSTLWHHIPLPEIDMAYENGTGLDGQKNEKTCPPKYNSGLFDVMVEKGSTRASFFGHDHINDFHVEYQGVTFSYGTKSTDRIYHEESMLGGQTITIGTDHSLTIQRIHHTYQEVE